MATESKKSKWIIILIVGIICGLAGTFLLVYSNYQFQKKYTKTESQLSADYQNTTYFKEIIEKRLAVLMAMGTKSDAVSIFSANKRLVCEEEEGYFEGVPSEGTMSTCGLYENNAPMDYNQYNRILNNDHNILYLVTMRKKVLFTNIAGAKEGNYNIPKGYNFHLSYSGNGVNISDNGVKKTVYGSRFYRGIEDWYVPGYENFSTTNKLKIKVEIFAKEKPECYDVGMDNEGGKYYKSVCNYSGDNSWFALNELYGISNDIASINYMHSWGITCVITGFLLFVMYFIYRKRLFFEMIISYAFDFILNRKYEGDYIRKNKYNFLIFIIVVIIVYVISIGSVFFISVYGTVNGYVGLLICCVTIVSAIFFAKKYIDTVINDMTNAINDSVKNERMKVELVTNVSHDIKTPLTSIISYVKLLKDEELPNYAREYVNIIDQKSERLKNIVQDVFDISKAASGQLPVNMQIIDFTKLISQTIAEMEEDINSSDVEVIRRLPSEEILIYADGSRIYRVFQNLLINALRYSLEGSRVYIDLKADGGIATAGITNISKKPLENDIDLTERFVRGDKSRTDGGSGLGLSIAKCFTLACYGEFKIETDADMFRVNVSFEVHKA